MSATTITPQELQEVRRSGKPVDLIDVRTPVEFRVAHVEGARLVPLDGLNPRAVYCQVGQRGYLALRVLQQAGWQAVNLGGGFKTYRLFAGRDASEFPAGRDPVR
jgi:rhodanese-related sulfurtransferase